jgi:hypothetical protein
MGVDFNILLDCSRHIFVLSISTDLVLAVWNRVDLNKAACCLAESVATPASNTLVSVSCGLILASRY